MTKLAVTVEHDGTRYAGRIAAIKSTTLGYNDHGMLDLWLNCTWDSSVIGIGGYCLDSPNAEKNGRIGTAYGLDLIIRVLETVGVESWEKLTGRQVVVLFPEGNAGWGGRAVGIAGLQNDKVLVLADHAAAWREKADA